MVSHALNSIQLWCPTQTNKSVSLWCLVAGGWWLGLVAVTAGGIDGWWLMAGTRG